MSKNVDIDALSEQVAGFGFAYLITVGDNDRIHTSAVNPVMAGDQLTVAAPSDRIKANALARPGISLVWPPIEEDGYSLIVDGEARTESGALRVTPTRAVLHRPAPRDTPPLGSTCLSDCREI